MRIVIAPDKFKGTLTAVEVARAMTKGIKQALPTAEALPCPMADGGEGTRSVLVAARKGVVERVSVEGPLGERISASIASLDDGSVIVESAAASGLHLVPDTHRNALRASSLGTGTLLRAALDHPSAPTAIVVAVGGTASTDGGTGMASALGWRFLDARGEELPRGGGSLRHLARIESPGSARSVPVVGACDVDASLTGPRGAARTYSPQKGATPDQVEILEDGLRNLEQRMREDLGVDVADAAHAGAGGGLGAGILAFLGGVLVPGFDLVARAVGLDLKIGAADLVLTGEGNLDEQSLQGKCAAGVARLARSAGIPCGVIAGDIDLSQETLLEVGFTAWASLAERVGTATAIDEAAASVTSATRSMMASMLA